MKDTGESWGRYPRATSEMVPLSWRSDPLPDLPGPLLPRGLGRSYGDSCLNDGGVLLSTTSLDRFISFDPLTGVLACEAGVTLAEVNKLCVPRGYFLPVTPGTKYVTVGGAIANDVHGKNHHRAGTFGRFVRRLELLRTDGSRRVCSPTENADWFRATVGGLGLTGLVTWAEVQLRPIESGWIDNETLRIRDLSEWFDVNAESEAGFEYTVSWVDCLASGKNVGRGFYMRGNHAGREAGPGPREKKKLAVPFDLPSFALSHPTMKVFNFGLHHKQLRRKVSKRMGFDPFFYPLDWILHWNRIYGRRGFFQYQLVVPVDGSRGAIAEVLDVIGRSGQASFLVVLKTFGDIGSPGILSFPRKGITLALDFPNRGERTVKLFERLDAIVAGAGGAVYPAKDARMPGEVFRRSFPRWESMLPFLDPRLSSSFWRRVNAAPAPARIAAA